MRAKSAIIVSLLFLGVFPGPVAAEESKYSRNAASILHHDPFKQPKLLEEPEKPDEPEVSAVIKVPPPWTRELRATMVAGQASMANVDGVLVTLGEQLDGFTLVEVHERSAVFEKETVRRVLTLN